MGEMLARLQAALSTLPPSTAPALWSHAQIESYLTGLLAGAEARRHADAVDERAYNLIRQKLALLDDLGDPPDYEPGWSHGDYHWRNVLFDSADEVAAVIDFDTVAYFSPARDVMRCIALSFPALGPEVEAFFAGYAAVRRPGPEEARGYVDLYRYLSSYRVWPVRDRYFEPETYDSRWDDLIQPMPAWDWGELSERLAAVAARAETAGPRDV
jgi:Ser/Thr protein kinase RdoA (MazF antagonist)